MDPILIPIVIVVAVVIVIMAVSDSSTSSKRQAKTIIIDTHYQNFGIDEIMKLIESLHTITDGGYQCIRRVGGGVCIRDYKGEHKSLHISIERVLEKHGDTEYWGSQISIHVSYSGKEAQNSFLEIINFLSDDTNFIEPAKLLKKEHDERMDNYD